MQNMEGDVTYVLFDNRPKVFELPAITTLKPLVHLDYDTNLIVYSFKETIWPAPKLSAIHRARVILLGASIKKYHLGVSTGFIDKLTLVYKGQAVIMKYVFTELVEHRHNITITFSSELEDVMEVSTAYIKNKQLLKGE